MYCRRLGRFDGSWGSNIEPWRRRVGHVCVQAFSVVGMLERQLFKDCQDARNCGYRRKERSARSQMSKLTENCLYGPLASCKCLSSVRQDLFERIIVAAP